MVKVLVEDPPCRGPERKEADSGTRASRSVGGMDEADDVNSNPMQDLVDVGDIEGLLKLVSLDDIACQDRVV